MHKPYNDFLLYENYMLIANDNILSCFDVNAEEFVAHQVFGGNNQLDVNNPVRSIFCYSLKKDSYGIGVLLQSGKIKHCDVKDDEQGSSLTSISQVDKGDITG